MTLIGQQPRPTASAARRKVASTRPASSTRVEEQIEMIVGKRLAAQLRDRRQRGVHWRGTPGTRAPAAVQGMSGSSAAIASRRRLFPHDENVGLLQIAFRRRRQGAGAQQAQQFRRNVAGEVAPVHAMGGDAPQFVEPGQRGVDRDALPETLGKRGLQWSGRVRASAGSLTGIMRLPRYRIVADDATWRKN